MKLIIYIVIALSLGMSIGNSERMNFKRPLAVKIGVFVIYAILLILLAKFLGVD